MDVRAITTPAEDSKADTIVVGVFDGEDLSQPELQALLDSGEAKRAHGSLGLTHIAGRRYLIAGLGPRERFDAERARVSAADAAKKANSLGGQSVCWVAPESVDDDVLGGLVEGTILAAYRFDRYKTPPEEKSEREVPLASLTLSVPGDHSAAIKRAGVIAQAVNAARTLQDTPGNDMTPSDLATRAKALGEKHASLKVKVEGRKQIIDRGMGAFAAVTQGSDQEPALITMRYSGPDAKGPVLGFVGKAVTFDSGGISIKPSAAMDEMKFDMSGGAAVIEAVGAIARLRLPVKLVAVVGATENLLNGRAAKPGDIVRTMSGVSVEINNTDAEGRLVLADCIAHAIAEGAERVIDLATLTGAIIVALGSTYAGLMSNDDDWAADVVAAGESTGELVWRMPLHDEYKKLIKGTYADINNAPERGKAGSITAAEFLARFAGDVPWAHLDIAGTAWDLGRAYADKSGSGFGVRLLVELASAQH